jgi:hypothetical protein
LFAATLVPDVDSTPIWEPLKILATSGNVSSWDAVSLLFLGYEKRLLASIRRIRYRPDMHKYLARFPLDLWAMLCSAASENSRSVNAEIIQRLRRSFEPVYRR